MLPALGVQLVAIGTYVYLLGVLAYGRPPSPLHPPPREATPLTTAGSRGGEVAWLACLSVVLLYPLAALVAPSAVLTGPLSVSWAGSTGLQVAGILLITFGGALAGWAFRSLGRYTTVELRISPDHTVIQGGPYARIRHPMYTAAILLGAGIALAFLSWVVGVLVLVIAVLARYRALTEERMFLSSPSVGSEYRAYAQRTGRFLPSGGRAGGGRPRRPPDS